MKMLTLIACFLVPMSARAGEIADWEKITPKDAGCSASFPGKPTVESRMNFSKIGALRVDRAILVRANGTRYWIVADELPRVANLPAPMVRLRGMRDRLVGPNDKVVKEEKITLGEQKIPGYALLIEKNASYHRVRLFLQGDRCFEICVIGTKGEVTSKDADRFLDSFELVK